MGDIDNLRHRVEITTIEMLKMLKERTDMIREIGEIKETTGRGIIDAEKEENLCEKVAGVADKIGLDTDIALRFLNFVLNESFKIQMEDRATHLSIFHKAKELEEKGREIIHMEIGQPDFAPPNNVKESLVQACERGLFKYGHANGMPPFRHALAEHISKKFGADTVPENILVSPGARFAIFSAITTLLNPGEELIVIEPAWPAYRNCAVHAGIRVRTIPTTLKDRWEPSIDQIRENIGPNTKMIVLNYPNNPTGKILPAKLQDEIIGIAKDNNMYVLSDEIYSEYAYSDWKSVLSYRYDKCIAVQSFSKSHAMTGFRIGYAVASRNTITKMAGMAKLCLTNVSEPIQYSAMKALGEDVSSNARTIKSRLDMLAREAKRLDLEFAKPDGAMYLYARIKQSGFDGTRFAHRLLDRGLAIAPGLGFGSYKDFIRISACQDENILMQGMNILSKEMENTN